MMVNKRFLEAALKDSALRAEVEHAALEALGEFLKAQGLEDEVGKVAEAAMKKVAEAHGFKADDAEELSEDEMKAVAGGVCVCPLVGGGTGYGKQCACVIFYGEGTNDSGRECGCVLGGFALDE